MKKQEKTLKTKSQNIKTKILNELRSELPLMQSKYLKKFRGNHNFINKFIFVPDLFNGGESDNMQFFIKNKCDLEKYLSSGGIEYDLIHFSVDKSMRLKFRYFFNDKESGLSGITSLIESAEGWKVGKIKDFD
jgi:hypothetical protein